MGPGATLDWLPSYAIWPLDINSDGTTDLTFGYDQWFTVQPANGATLAMDHPSSLVYDAPPLTAGTVIGSTLDNGRSWQTSKSVMVDWEVIPGFGTFGAGSWAFVTNGYLGVSFSAVDGVHYGWVQITSFPDQRAYIHSWAYESQPGVEILAGVVPEPSTIGLLLLGSGVVGLASWRRRRQNAVSAEIK